MFILFLINLVFSSVTITDNCTNNFCQIEVKNGNVLLRKIDTLPSDKKTTWHLNVSELTPNATTVIYSNAGSEGALIGKAELGKKARQVSQKVLDLIAGHNLGLSLTTVQINELKVTYAVAKTYLDDGQPWGAKAAIDTIAVNEPIVTQELLDQINTIFSESGLPGL